MIWLLLSAISALYYYVEAVRAALPAKRWALLGLLGGPLLLPLFSIQRHMRLRQAQGFGNLYLRA